MTPSPSPTTTPTPTPSPTPTPTDPPDETEVLAAETDDETADAPARPWDPQLPMRLVKGAAIAVVVVALLAVTVPRLIGGGDSSGSDKDEKAGSDRPAAGTEGDGAPGGAADNGSPDGSADPAPAEAPADLLPLGPAVPAKPGSYELQVVIDDRAVSGAYTVTGDGASQVHRTELDGSVSEQELRWGDGALSLVATTDPAAGTCKWSPAPLLVAADMEVGKKWDTASDCSVARDGATLAVHQESSAEVVERGQTTVGGRAVEVWVVQRHETQTRKIGQASVESDVLSSELVAPQLGLVLERLTQADVVQGDGSTHTVTVVEQIQELP